MKVAIIGAGLAGLASAWHLLQEGGVDVTVFDGGRGASWASTGLLHECPGKKALPTNGAKEGMASAIDLLNSVSKRRPVYEKSGILRFAVNEEQKKAFQGDAIWLPDGISVYPRIYLEELKKECSEATFIQKNIPCLDALHGFDAHVIAAGIGTALFFDLPMKKTIGQMLVCRCKKRLPYAILAKAHITPTEEPQICLVGSTYEHTDQPHPHKALALLEQAAFVYPEAKEFDVLDIRTGVRCSPMVGHQPILQRYGDTTWVFAGLGSRGLIYHALFAKMLVKELRRL
ncbi:MAG: hypothetical protein A3D96_00450 [Chlamydiae bacterium RIFCSPHIGHO2_12_FULL_44_59]|nr:MAG: hypothetical protein A2796_07595 [Chlamydiae bacterium RIFCSPHIGHO2_01_FULL_44_39]OGN60851.1 MAG: hypothetical protein A3D96_00450 [Chlamydiae bacterium RIFCSPHIGHO2_12_FULL_44_59]OGN66727.1 MAG: hypothetical protein A2978_03085 [Chlamydiae bacterium RIFCSPLOWO2_01_FULL_44_52]OGN67377.1 MAG: hypothetical protein A3I67_06280 [Chlamydiae bacterium RIFCSPLOWO2_02_FULL_45_22]OGN70652.1 MAG: hypothetical protein A3F79_07195 [Chlamydiae bacterium RIFCSPLOWO2_12_FULL_45_20]